MARKKTSELINQAKLAEDLNLDPTFAKYIVYFRAINGLEKSGAIFVKEVTGKKVTFIHRERFRHWLYITKQYPINQAPYERDD